jgi:hypothetical protein
MTELAVIAEPQCTAHFHGDDAILESGLILSRPDASFIKCPFMIDAKRTTARVGATADENQR